MREVDEPARAPATRTTPDEGDAAHGAAWSPEAGARVRVLRGPFARREGVVVTLDGRGAARLTMGQLVAKVDLVDLEPVVAARARPALPSSHRKPADRAARSAGAAARKAR